MKEAILKKKELTEKLSILQQILLKINGKVFLRYEKREGWTNKLPIFLLKCEKHGYFEDYPHGYKGYFLCSECFKEEVKQNANNKI